MENRIPTNRAENGKVIYASQELLNSIYSYEECVELSEKGSTLPNDYYWYNNSAWSSKEPIGLISKEDAFEEDKPGCAFIYFDDTIPAYYKTI